MDILECFQLQMPKKPISKWPKQKEFIGLHKKSSGLAGPKDAGDVKITFLPTLSPLIYLSSWLHSLESPITWWPARNSRLLTFNILSTLSQTETAPLS